MTHAEAIIYIESVKGFLNSVEHNDPNTYNALDIAITALEARIQADQRRCDLVELLERECEG